MAFLSGIGIENFRVFKEYTEFDFAPLTLLTGANNSGKSSLIKALLLLAVNAENRNIERFTLNTELQSSVTKLGNFDSLANNPEKPIAFHLHFDNLYEILPRPVHIEEIADIIFEKLAKHKTQITLKFNHVVKDNLVFFAYDIFVESQFITLFSMTFNRSQNTVETALNSKWIEKFINSIIEKEAKDLYKINKSKNQVREIDDSRIKDIYTIIELIFDDMTLGVRNQEKSKYRYLKILDAVFTKLVEIALDTIKFENKIDYLPAFRGNQDRFYSSDVNLPLNQLLKQFTDNRFTEESPEKKYINKWVVNLGIADKIDFIPHIGGTEVNITKNGKVLQVADIGYGMTQYLPILLQIALTKANYLLIEEAENSLHPNFQSQLADLLIDAYSFLNKKTRFIVETHSEYLVRKLQYLTVTKKIAVHDIAIYYFGLDGQVRRIDIQEEDGELKQEFGKGFFDESARWIGNIWKVANLN
jgi:AAA15 family ATPase/GTPase